jgi:hypothetical protein
VAAHFWTAVILAPPIFPLAFAALLTIILHPAASPVIVFALTAISAIVFSYAVTVLLFLPALWLLSKVIRLQAPIVCQAGAAVGAACHQLIVLKRPAADNAHTARPDLFIPFFAAGMGRTVDLGIPACGLHHCGAVLAGGLWRQKVSARRNSASRAA